MRKVNVAIISKRQNFIRFFELEALNFGFSVSLFEKMPSESLAFDLLVVDSASVKQLPSAENERLLLVSEGENMQPVENGRIKRMTYPAPIAELRRIYGELLYGDSKSEATIEQGLDGEKIVVYRDLANTVRYRGRNISLSDYEMRLLVRLCRNKDEAVSREELNLLLGAESGNIADVYICRLRKKLEEGDGKRVIFTVRSKGYRISSDIEWK